MLWTEKLAKWLEAGKERSETLLGIPWDVQRKEEPGRDIIVATHPKVPFNVEVYIGKYFATLLINPGITTNNKDVGERMEAYRKMLHINTRLNLMKMGLAASDDRVVITVDLALSTLGKEEFNDALTALIIGAMKLIEVMELNQEITSYLLERQVGMIMGMYDRGESEEDILAFLVDRLGLDSELAEQLVKKAK